MKKSSAIQLLTALIACSLLLSNCKKNHEIHKRAFKATTKTWYRVSPTTPTPVSVNGTTYGGFARFPGGGSGNATHLGNCNIFFKQLVYGTSPQAPPAGSVAAPVQNVPGYPITGAPLPLIQAGDFSVLIICCIIIAYTRISI